MNPWGRGIPLISVTPSVELRLAQTGIGPANVAEERVWLQAAWLTRLLSRTHTTSLLVSLVKPANMPKLGLNRALKFNHPPREKQWLMLNHAAAFIHHSKGNPPREDAKVHDG